MTQPAEKQPDEFEALMYAIMRLKDVVRSMGPEADLAEIVLKPTHRGADEVERAIKRSPSYLQTARFLELGLTRNADVLCQIAGVNVVAKRKK